MDTLDTTFIDDPDIDWSGLEHEAALPDAILDELLGNLAHGDGTAWLGCAITFSEVEVYRHGVGHIGSKEWVEVRRGEDRAVIARFPGAIDEDDLAKLQRRYPRSWEDELYQIAPLRRAFHATSESFAALVRLLGSVPLKEVA